MILGVLDQGDRNYLRVRGEYDPKDNRIATRLELPPRARRIRKQARNARIDYGTTSACAENTT